MTLNQIFKKLSKVEEKIPYLFNTPELQKMYLQLSSTFY